MKRGIFGSVGLVILAVIGFGIYLSLFIVSQTQQALVLRFGNPVRVVTAPGLYYKLPLIDNVVYLDKRILDLASPPLEVIASDQKRLVVDAWGRYRITEPLRFFQSVNNVQVADSRLSDILNSAVRRVLGDATFIQLVRDERADLMTLITTQVDREAEGLGIEVIDVKLRRADLPEANSQAIYQRMQTERQREATEIRAQGEQAARRIRAEADRQATIIVAEANKESEQVRGDGEGQRNTIFAEAFGADPGFFAFYRSMQAYQQGLRGTDTRLVITPNSEFFRYFNDASGQAMPAAPANVPPPAQAIPGAAAAPAAAVPAESTVATPAPASAVEPVPPAVAAPAEPAPPVAASPQAVTPAAMPTVPPGPAPATVQ